MATSGTTSWNPAASALTLTAFGRIGLRRTELTIQHLQDAANEANLLQVGLGGQQPNLWRSSLSTQVLTQGTATYNLPSAMIAVQDVYITTVPSGAGNSSSTDRLIAPLTLFEYDSQPNKTIQAAPTAYLVQKLTPTPTITFWQVPDGSATYTANIRILSRQQDVSMANGTTLDMPFTYLDVFVAGLAHRLARIYAPDKEMVRRQDYFDALALAQQTDTQDNTSLFISPQFSAYSRR